MVQDSPAPISGVQRVECLYVFEVVQTHSRKQTTISLSLEERVSKTKVALEKNFDSLQLSTPKVSLKIKTRVVLTVAADDFEDLPDTFYQMSKFDQLSNFSLDYSSKLSGYFQSVNETFPGFRDSQIVFAYGYAAAQAYLSYNDTQCLSYAETAWELLNQYTLSPSQAASRSSPFKANVTISAECQSSSLAGGSFRAINPSDPLMDTLTSSYSMILSSLLSKITSNSKYHDAAFASFEFMYSHLFEPNSHAVYNSIQAENCTVDMSTLSENSAVFLEGVAILGAVSGNATLKGLANDIATSAISNHAFQNSITGILLDSPGTGYLMRALYPIYTLNSDNSSIQELVSSFISTQYNSLIGFASDGNDNYSGDLNGPGFVPYSFANETRALYVLLGGIVIDSPLNDSSPIPQPPPDSSMNSSNPAPVGAIVGGAVGGAFVLALLILFGFMFRKYRRRMKQRALSSEQRPDAYDGVGYPQNASSTAGMASQRSYTPVTQQLPSKRERETRRYPAASSSPPHPASGQIPSTTTSGTAATSSSNAGRQSGREASPANTRRRAAPDGDTEQNAVTEVLVGLLNQRLREQQHSDDQPAGSAEVLEPPPGYGTVLRTSGRTTPSS